MTAEDIRNNGRHTHTKAYFHLYGCIVLGINVCYLFADCMSWNAVDLRCLHNVRMCECKHVCAPRERSERSLLYLLCRSNSSKMLSLHQLNWNPCIWYNILVPFVLHGRSFSFIVISASSQFSSKILHFEFFLSRLYWMPIDRLKEDLWVDIFAINFNYLAIIFLAQTAN